MYWQDGRYAAAVVPVSLQGGGAAAQRISLLQSHLADLDPGEAAELAALAAVAHATWAAAATAGRSGGSGTAAVGVSDVLRALCWVQVNGVAVVPAERAGHADRLALALYPTASLMNHACSPTVAVHFEVRWQRSAGGVRSRHQMAGQQLPLAGQPRGPLCEGRRLLVTALRVAAAPAAVHLPCRQRKPAATNGSASCS